MTSNDSGVARLGYLGFEVASLDAWASFATGILGLEVAAGSAAGLDLRMDAHARRFLLTEGPSDDLSVVGWEVDDAAALDAVAARLVAAGTPVEEGSRALAELRGVQRLVCFRDPAGVPSEVYTGPAIAGEPFRPSTVKSGFVTGEQGLGHVVLTARDREESGRFYRDALGLALSDRIVCEVFGHPVDIAFLHARRGAARHHSIALGAPLPKRIHHFMLEVRSIDDVGLAFDRALRAGVRIVLTLGRHPNDRMFSFYAQTPSGFEFEVGWGGRVVDDAAWEEATYGAISEWGHHPPELLAPRRRPKPPEEAK